MLISKKRIFLILVFIAVFGLGVWLGKGQVVCKVCQPEDVNFSLFWETWHKLQERYVDTTKLDVQKMIYGAISGMVGSLKDPYTVFLNPNEAKKFLDDVTGHFEGVGMEIGIKKGQLQIISPIEGTPAQKAGLRAGDKILKINDTLTGDIRVEEAVDLIRGNKGTEVTLSILRKDWDSPKEFKIVRDVIEVPSLKWELLSSLSGKADEKGDIAYIKLYQFSENAYYEFSKAAVEIINSPARKIILDLRNNPGGYLEVSKDIAGWFLENGQTVVIEDFGGKTEQKIYKAQGNSQLLDYPIVILINQGSASAAEILASALQDDRDVKLIGETSFGKGSVQELESLSDGSDLKVTIADWLTPKGKHITDIGLTPDVKIEMTEEDYNAEKDPQLEKAIEIINSLR